MPSESDSWSRGIWSTLDRFLNYLLSCIICTHFSYIEYALRIHFVNISSIFIKYELRTERSKGFAHARFVGPIRGETSRFFINMKPFLGHHNHFKTHNLTSRNTPVLRELRFI